MTLPRLATRLRIVAAGCAAALLPLAAGCGHDPLSSRRATEDPAASFGAAVAPVHGIALRRGPDGGTLALRFGGAPGVATLPLAPAPASGRAWTFQVAFDLDRNARTGDASGAERAVALVAPDRAAWLSLEGGRWTRVAESRVRRAGGVLEVAVPGAMMPRGSRPAAKVETYLTSSAGDGLVSLVPVECAAFAELGDDEHERLLPRLQWMRAWFRNDSLVFRAQLLPADRDVAYDPDTPGGWMLQLFLDFDGYGQGYGDGYDWIVRGGEWDGERFVVRRIQPGDQWPGGWGPPTGFADFDYRTRSLTVTVPRSALGRYVGPVRYKLEVYETIVCDACPGGFTHAYFDLWRGATDEAPGRGTVRPLAELEHGSPRYGIAPPSSPSADAAR